LISPPSHCPSCERKIPRRDLIPLLSYLLLKGHCRYCKSSIPVRVFLVELFTGLLLVFLLWHFGLRWELLIVALYSFVFIVLFVIDMEHGILPNKIIYPAAVAALIMIVAGSIAGYEPYGITAGMGNPIWIVDAVIGFAIGFVFFFIVALIFRGGMGWGDVKLAGLMGLLAGYPLIIVAIFIAIVGGGLLAALLIATRIKSRKDAIPFGPFLTLAAIVTLIWGQHILNWYLGMAL
ncbi:MAG: prepilin peptidase, partial [Acidobacteria bacterium]|nr:prepilin peptidase [Acidobacteriota bacterium]